MSGTADFLLELLSEEIPARMQAKARNDLARMMAEALAAAGLSHDGITTYSTPRRLALIARGLPAATEAVSEELKGPKTSAPGQALDGFLRKTGLTQDRLQDRDGVWFAVIDKPGRATADVLAEAVAAIVADFQWPKSMRWGAASASTASLRWVRPLHSIVALLGEEIVPVAVDGVTGASSGKVGTGFPSDGATTIKAGAATLGHRFHHPGAITIGGAHDYVEKLRACHVLVDQAERETIIRDGAVAAAAKAGFGLVEDEGLVVENAGLTEWPVPLLGAFDADYLDVPPEVIQLTARTNQKYFVMRDGAGALAPRFVCIANIDAKDGGLSVIAGNERVLAARLSDARFFWQQDVKVPLEERLKGLDRSLFFEGLGSYGEKAGRISVLAAHIAKNFAKDVDPQQAGRAAELAKADLVTGTVGEFPELQGIIGGYLAARQAPELADAIAAQYRDDPKTKIAQIVGIADRVDTLVAFFARGQKPTGSKDPFALRRAALHVIKIISENGLRLPLLKLFEKAESQLAYDRQGLSGGLEFGELMTFFADRLKVQQREAGVRHDLIDAVFALGGEDDLVRLLARVTALQAFVDGGEGANLLAGYKRAANILKKEKWDAAATSDADVLPGEAALTAALDAAGPHAAEAVEAEDFAGAMRALASLRAPIDAFFDKVIVNDPVARVRARRLNLLARFRDAVHAVADFSRIEG